MVSGSRLCITGIFEKKARKSLTEYALSANMRIMESVSELKARKEVLEMLVETMASIRGGKRLDLVPEVTRREEKFRAELADVDAALKAAPANGRRKAVAV